MKKIAFFLVFTALFLFLFASNCFCSIDANSNTNKDLSVLKYDSAGPTITLGYDVNSLQIPLYNFMYFVPVISPTAVESSLSNGSTLTARLISHHYEQNDDSFEVISEFEMKGQGTFKNFFDHEEMIKYNLDTKNDKTEKLSKLLDYICFEGEGFGWLEITGTIETDVKTIEQVKIYFNGRNQTSPVTIGVYDIPQIDGKYLYSNSTNHLVARVNCLEFKKPCDEARMGIELAAVGTEESVCGFWAKVKGKIANLFIKPITVDENGNQSMLDFGLAIAEKKEAFTFPKAANLKIAADNAEKAEKVALKSPDFEESLRN